MRRNKRGQRRDPKRSKLNHSAVTRYEDVAAYRRFTEAWLRPAAAQLEDDGHAIVWTNLLGQQPILDVAVQAGLVHHGIYRWAKVGRQGNIGEQVARLYEVALVFGRGPAPALGPDARCPPQACISGFDDDGEGDRWERHPNHKAFHVLEPLLRYWSRPGGLVLEPFSGSGSTAAAAVRLGRVARALELRATWADLSGRRLEATVADCGRSEASTPG